jgi:acyl CoA:acetate/3-ketoacid CoA transferase beta subunit
MMLIELAGGVTLDKIKDKAEASFKVAPDLKTKVA